MERRFFSSSAILETRGAKFYEHWAEPALVEWQSAHSEKACHWHVDAQLLYEPAFEIRVEGLGIERADTGSFRVLPLHRP